MNNNLKIKSSLVFLMVFAVFSFSFLLVNFVKAAVAPGGACTVTLEGVDDCQSPYVCHITSIIGSSTTGTCVATTSGAISNTPNSGGSSVVTLGNPLQTDSIPKIIGKVINAALGIVGSLALLMFIFGGITWMTAAGNEQSVTKGKNIIIWAALGLVVIFSSYAIVKLVLQAIGA